MFANQTNKALHNDGKFPAMKDGRGHRLGRLPVWKRLFKGSKKAVGRPSRKTKTAKSKTPRNRGSPVMNGGGGHRLGRESRLTRFKKTVLGGSSANNSHCPTMIGGRRTLPHTGARVVIDSPFPKKSSERLTLRSMVTTPSNKNITPLENEDARKTHWDSKRADAMDKFLERLDGQATKGTTAAK